jgi:hypothetical protein
MKKKKYNSKGDIFQRKLKRERLYLMVHCMDWEVISKENFFYIKELI